MKLVIPLSGALPAKKIDWPEAGIYLELVPLPEDKDAAFVRQCTTTVDKGKKKGQTKFDAVKYAELVGCHCIKGWGPYLDDEDETTQQNKGVVDIDGTVLACTSEAITAFMQITPAQNFVFHHAKSLGLHMVKELGKPKQDSET